MSRVSVARERAGCFACFEPSRVDRRYVNGPYAAHTPQDATHLLTTCRVCGNKTYWDRREENE